MTKSRNSGRKVTKRSHKIKILREKLSLSRANKAAGYPEGTDGLFHSQQSSSGLPERTDKMFHSGQSFSGLPEEPDGMIDPIEEFPPLDIEKDSNPPLSLTDVLKGRRIVDLAHLLSEYENVVLHRFRCITGRMRILRESRRGLLSFIHFKCDVCEKCIRITTETPDRKSSDINKAAVWGSVSIGIGYSQCEEFLGMLNVPFMSDKTYRSNFLTVKKVWENQIQILMAEAGKQEKDIAIENGDIDANGIPFITVIVDGGWSKRSYGHGYNASSGVAVIIGAKTKKLLYIGIKNKICSTCAFHKRNGTSAKNHECVMNFQGPSTAMEQEIVVEGFRTSLEQHGLMYKYMIGDGDSSVYARIVEKVSYGRQVSKIECANHMTRCVSDKLHRLAKNTTFPIEMRKSLTEKSNGNLSRLERLVKGIRTSIKRNSCDPEALRNELKNAPFHVFGQHKNCSDEFCTKKNDETEMISTLSEDFLLAVKKILDPLINKSHQVAYNETTNQAERYMSLVAKLTGGKRVNFTKSFSYQARATASALSHSLGPSWHLPVWTGMSRDSPGAIMKSVFCRKQHKYATQKSTTKKRRHIPGSGADMHYGPDAAKEDLAENQLEESKRDFLNQLSQRVNTVDGQIALHKMTIGQHDNKLWSDLRRDYLTASNFGVVMKRRLDTSCHNLIKKMLYSVQTLNTAPVTFGRLYEEVAIRKYEELKGVHVEKCGIFIDYQNIFLGASPDGLLGNDGLVEVKCLYSVNNFTDCPKNACYTIQDGKPKLKRKHSYYFQVQGQLNITRRRFCDVILYSKSGEISVERIMVDEDLWRNEMVPKLTSFYMDCILPEIVDGRIPRGMKARDPDYIVEAQKKKENKRTSD